MCDAARLWAYGLLRKISTLAVAPGDVAWSVLPPWQLSRPQRLTFIAHRLELRRRAPTEDYGDRELAFLRGEELPRPRVEWDWPSGPALDVRSQIPEERLVEHRRRFFRDHRR